MNDVFFLNFPSFYVVVVIYTCLEILTHNIWCVLVRLDFAGFRRAAHRRIFLLLAWMVSTYLNLVPTTVMAMGTVFLEFVSVTKDSQVNVLFKGVYSV